jgi:hypothetical protein
MGAHKRDAVLPMCEYDSDEVLCLVTSGVMSCSCTPNQGRRVRFRCLGGETSPAEQRRMYSVPGEVDALKQSLSAAMKSPVHGSSDVVEL